ncbi:MAG: hypothetical protein ACT452_17265 [Microthrixaceae bacterium]
MRPHLWRAPAVLALVVSTAACSEGTTKAPSAGVPTSSEPATASTAPSVIMDSEVGPSVLDLLEGRGQYGTFSIALSNHRHDGGHDTYTGRYVRTASGTTYTVADMDLPLVREEVERLLAMHERFDALEPLFADAFLSRDTVVTNQLQLGLADVLMRVGVFGEAGAFAMMPWFAVTVVEDNPLGPCQEALAAMRSAVEDRVAGDAARLGRGWTPDADRLGATERKVAEQACDGLSGPDAPGIDLEVDDVTFSVTVDGEQILTLAVQPADGEPLTVSALSPAPMLDGFGLFFLAVDRCGELPWAYSNFAAANSYTSPDEHSYIGPGPYSEMVCAAEVPR